MLCSNKIHNFTQPLERMKLTQILCQSSTGGKIYLAQKVRQQIVLPFHLTAKKIKSYLEVHVTFITVVQWMICPKNAHIVLSIDNNNNSQSWHLVPTRATQKSIFNQLLQSEHQLQCCDVFIWWSKTASLVQNYIYTRGHGKLRLSR